MQNNGLVKLFAVLFVLVSIYQLSFTFIVNRTEDNARAYALEKVDENSQITLMCSMLQNVSISILFRQISILEYANAKVRELNKGLDLKGGLT